MSACTGSARDAAAPIFVVGAGRSGTTLLRLMLNAHPDVAIPSESHFIVPFIRTFGPRTVLEGTEIDRAVDYVVSSEQWQRDFGHTECELRAAIGTDPLDVPTFVDRVFRLEVGPDAARWGDKTPANLLYVDVLLEAFPRAQVVGVVRDPRDVHISLKSLGWFGTTTWDIGRYIARNATQTERWKNELTPKQFSVVRYEDLVLETEASLRTVCTQLDLEFADEMRSFFRSARENVQPWEVETIHQKLLRAPSPDDVGRWRREGSKRDHAEIESLTGEMIDRYGYDSTLSSVTRAALRFEARVRHHARDPGELLSRSWEQARRRIRRAPATSETPGGQPSRSA